MSQSIIGEQLWAEMTEAQKAEAVRRGRATLKQMTEGLLDGSDDLRKVCGDFLAHTDDSLEDISIDHRTIEIPPQEIPRKTTARTPKRRRRSKPKRRVPKPRKAKQRFGLPEGFAPRFQRDGRSVLLEDNVYRLPNGQEYIPQHPTGTLGKLRHLYALLTPEQYDAARRGSVYVHTDGRVFDYSVDHGDPARDIFDTGYTISDLERTGRYASEPRAVQRRSNPLKQRHAAQAS
ncbi:MAG: hypothetical protein ACREBG_11975 [Pyrinomonadaceae bacterium]